MMDRRGLGSRLALPVAALLTLGACATAPSSMDYGIPDAGTRYVWPAPPEPPRYRLVGELSGAPNFSSYRQQPAFGTRLLRWVAGLAGPHRKPDLLEQPQGGYVGEDGRIYVADVSQHAVFVFEPDAGRLLVWRMAGKVAQFATPVAVTGGANGETLVVDADLKLVVRLDAKGVPLGTIGQGQFDRPVGIARDAARGRIFVADAHAHVVKIFKDSGELIGTLGSPGEGEGEFNTPTYLAYARDRLYVTDTMNARVQIFDAEGRFVRQFGRRGVFVGDLPRPKGVAVDTEGNIYVVESYYDHLLVFSDIGDLLLAIGGSGSGIGEFYLPAGVWTDHRNRVYVADAFNHRVIVFQFLGGGA
jgi:sugar lactone lactonase YvrE